MNTQRSVVGLALVAALCAPGLEAKERRFVQDYELDATSATYCATTDFAQGAGRVVTDGSNVTVTSVGGASIFGGLAAGDELFVNVDGETQRRVIQAVASTSSLTITSAADWDNSDAGRAWRFRHVTCGTGAEDGWLSVHDATWVQITVEIDAISVDAGSDGILVTVQGRHGTTGAVTIYPDPANAADTNDCKSGTYSAALKCVIIVSGHYDQLRVGLMIDSADDGVDTGANAEDVTLTLVYGAPQGGS